MCNYCINDTYPLYILIGIIIQGGETGAKKIWPLSVDYLLAASSQVIVRYIANKCSFLSWSIF